MLKSFLTSLVVVWAMALAGVVQAEEWVGFEDAAQMGEGRSVEVITKVAAGGEARVKALNDVFRGDVNGDRRVDLGDFQGLKEGLGREYSLYDFAILKSRFGQELRAGVTFLHEVKESVDVRVDPYWIVETEGNSAWFYQDRTASEPYLIGEFDQGKNQVRFLEQLEEGGSRNWKFDLMAIDSGDWGMTSYSKAEQDGTGQLTDWQKYFYTPDGIIARHETKHATTTSEEVENKNYYQYEEIAGRFVPIGIDISSVRQSSNGSYVMEFSKVFLKFKHQGVAIYRVESLSTSYRATNSDGLQFSSRYFSYDHPQYRYVAYESNQDLYQRIEGFQNLDALQATAWDYTYYLGEHKVVNRRNENGELVPVSYRKINEQTPSYAVVGDMDFLTEETNDIQVNDFGFVVNHFWVYGDFYDAQGKWQGFGIRFIHQNTGATTYLNDLTQEQLVLGGVTYWLVFQDGNPVLLPV